MSNASSDIEQTKQTQTKASLVTWNPWLGVVFVVVVYFVSQLMSGLVVYVYASLFHAPQAAASNWLDNSVGSQFAYILITEALAIGALYLFLRMYRAGWSNIGFYKPRWQDAGYGLMMAPVYFLVYVASVVIISQFIPGLNINQTQDIGFNDVQGPAALIMTFVSLVVLPPLAEEIMVRGFLYSSLKKAVRPAAAVIGTSLIFAVAHLPEGGAAGPLYIAAIDTFILSLVLIYLREKTGSLWAGITLHALKNGVAFMVLFVFHVR